VGQYAQIITVEANKAAITITVGTGSNRRTLKLNIVALPHAMVVVPIAGRVAYYTSVYRTRMMGIAGGGQVPVRRCRGVTDNQPSAPRE
jgi:hypothetical protein